MKLSRCAAVLLISLCLTSTTRADEDQDKQIAELKAKVASLEKRVAALEQMLSPMKAEAQKKALRELYDSRVAQDAKKYSADQLKEAESLYKIALHEKHGIGLMSSAADQLASDYPDVNLTGCLTLYLGQTTSDTKDKEYLLKLAIEKHSDCVQADGVQVGAYARYLLALYYKEKGNNGKAASLFDEIRKDYPFAVDHKGRALEDQMQ